MITHLWLVSLQQVLKQLAHAYDTLWVRRDSLQVTNIFAVESSENEVNFLFLVTDVAERSEVATEMLNWDNTTWWVHTDWLIMGSIRNKGCIWLGTKCIENLSVAEEHHHTGLHNVLEDKVFIIIADLDNVGKN